MWKGKDEGEITTGTGGSVQIWRDGWIDMSGWIEMLLIPLYIVSFSVIWGWETGCVISGRAGWGLFGLLWE